MSPAQADLFGHAPPAPALPQGMRYEREFLTPAEEQSLAGLVAAMPLKERSAPRS